MTDTRLSAPWYTLWRKIYFTLSEDKDILVSGLNKEDGGYSITVTAKQMHTAYALSQIIKPVFEFGNVKVKVIIEHANVGALSEFKSDEIFSEEEVGLLIGAAFRGNKLFKGVIVIPRNEDSFFSGKVVALFDKEIIQFYNDDLTDIFGNYNEVAAYVFADIINFSYKNKLDKDIYVLCNTYDYNSINEDDLFCT